MEKSRYWSSFQVSFATYFGGPLAGCYLISQNFKILENEKLQKKALHYGIIFTIILFLCLFFLPQEWTRSIPKVMIPIVYTLGITMLGDQYQKLPLLELKRSGSKRYSFFRLLLVMLIAIITYLPVVFLFGYITTLI